MEDLLENIEKQLLEIEILKNVYSNPNEFSIEDEEAYCDANNFIRDRKFVLLKNLGFVLKFNINLDEENIKQLPIEIMCRFPLDYPLKAQPEILVRCSRQSLNRKFYENLVNQINSIHTNDCIILELLEWIKENVPSYIDSPKASKVSTNKSSQLEVSRAWIYFHHIFSHDKRQRIISLAREFKLTGFSHPGKPGMACVEGCKDDVDEFIRQLKKLPWKKMQIKEIEHESVEKQNEFRKFDSFDELLFESENQTNHVDLGLLFNYLKEKNFSYILNLFFGINGDVNK